MRMPIGLTNVAPTFQRAFDILIAHFQRWSCLVYPEDIILFSSSLDDHLKNFREIMATLRDAGTTVKLRKCEFFTSSVTSIGHVIRPERLLVEKARVRSLTDAKHSNTQTYLRSFLGWCSVYRSFIFGSVKVVGPLNEFIKKEQLPKLDPFTSAQAAAFDSLKDALNSAPFLSLSKKDLPFTADTDSIAY